MKKKRKITHIFFILMLFSIIVTATLITALYLFNSYNEHRKLLKIKRENFEKKQKELLFVQVDNAVSMVRTQRNKLIEDTKLQIKVRVDTIYGILNNLYKKYDGKITPEEFRQKASEVLTPLQYNDQLKSYFIADLKGTEILYPLRPEYEGVNMLDFQSLDGRYVVREMIQLVKEKGHGFLTYKWDKTNGKKRYLDYIAYVKLFKPLNWYIGLGTGYYNEEEKLKEKLVKKLAKIRYGKNRLGYLFVNTYDGVDLVAEYLEGKKKDNNNWDITDPNGIKIVQEERKAAIKPEGGYIKYTWINPATGKFGKKIAFVKGIPEWRWMIGAGVYLDDIEEELNIISYAYNKLLYKNILQAFLFVTLIFALLLPLIYIVQKSLKKEFSQFLEVFDVALLEGKKIDKSKIMFSEFDNLAGNINRILEEKAKSELQLAESEKKYRSLFESATDAVIILDTDMNILDVNSTMLKMYEIDSKENAIAFNLEELSGDMEQTKQISKLWDKMLQGDELSFEWKAKKPTKNKVFDALVSAKKVSLEGRDLVIINVKDITLQKQTEEELLKIKKLESLGILAGGIAHDFNNLLSGIFGHLSIIKTKTDKANPIYNNILSAEKAMERTVDLTKQLLTFAKGGEPVKETVDIGKLIEETAGFTMHGSAVKLITHIADNLYSAKVDRGQISQVIANLIINGCQAMGNVGEIVICAENFNNKELIKPTLEKGCYVKISVQDKGCGIKSEIIKKIFDPYFTTKSKGTGLGLASSFSIIKKHGGLIEVESEVGKGSTFTVFLKAYSQKLAEQNDNDNFRPDIKKKNIKVLLMDDEEFILAMACEMLQSLGHICDTVSKGEDAIVKYKSELNAGSKFDLVIMDLTVPGGMGGKDAVKELLKIDKDVVAVVSSGYSNDPVMSNYREYGFSAVIAKPYTIEQLEKTIVNLFG
jgi:PAS domain S-box-containing protein